MKVKKQYLKIIEYLHLSFNGEQCWLGNGPEDDHWHLQKVGKSQRVITERGGFSRSAVSKHIKCKVDWKEEIG